MSLILLREVIGTAVLTTAAEKIPLEVRKTNK